MQSCFTVENTFSLFFLCVHSDINQTTSQFIISDRMTEMVMNVLNSENELATRGQEKSYYYAIQ